MYEEIESLYKVFSRYQKPRDFEACDHCWSEVEKRDLLKTELRKLRPDMLSNYAMDAFCTAGGLPDFKYFLPRILELTVLDNSWWLDPEIVLGKLRLAEWDDWPENEKTIVRGLLEEKFRALLEDPNTEGQDIDTWICALSRCLDDITPYLDLLSSKASEDALLSFFESNSSALARGKLSNAFWDSPQNERRVIEWFHSPRVKQILTDKHRMIF